MTPSRWIATAGSHLLSCRLLDEACTADDLATVRERAKACAPQVGENCVKDTKEEERRHKGHPFG